MSSWLCKELFYVPYKTTYLLRPFIRLMLKSFEKRKDWVTLAKYRKKINRKNLMMPQDRERKKKLCRALPGQPEPEMRVSNPSM